MDADDVSLPDRLAMQVDHMLKSDAHGMVGSQISYLIDEKIIPALPFPTDHATIYAAFLARRFPLCHPTILFRVDLARAVGGYRISRYGEDLDFMLRMSEVSRVANTAGILHCQRIHRNSGSFRSSYACSVGQTYALHCLPFRRNGLPEPSFNEFLEQRNGLAGTLAKLADWKEAQATVQYRKHILCRAQGRSIASCSHLAIAALCHLDAVASRLKQTFIQPEENSAS
jgi:hypothetical protein